MKQHQNIARHVAAVLSTAFGMAGTGLFVGTTTGCGGAKASPTPLPPARSIRPSITINWAARSRDINAPASAKSANITFTGINGTSTTFNVERNNTPAAYSEEYEGGAIEVQGNPTLRIIFYADAPAASAVVAQANASVPINSSGEVTTTVTNIQKSVASVEVSGNQSVNVGESKFLTYTAKNGSGGIVAVGAGSAFFTAVSGADKLEVNGEVGKGVAGGTASVTATVDNVTSPANTVTIVPAVKVAFIANPRDPETTDIQNLLTQKGIAFTAYATMPELSELQKSDVVMVMGSSTNYPAVVTGADAPRIADFVQSGRGVVLLEDAPAALSGYDEDDRFFYNGYNLSSIAGWFGNATHMLRYRYYEEIFALDNTAFLLPPGILAGSQVYDGRSGEGDYWAIHPSSINTPRPQFQIILSDRNLEAAEATTYQNPNGGGRVYWQFHPFGPNPTYTDKVLSLLLAGTNWAANR